MNVLGIDTSTSATAVALAMGDVGGGERRDDPVAGAHPGHATKLLGMVQELLGDTGARWEQIERIAVGVGPGAFTGLRVGVATARGLAQSLAIEIVGVSSPLALADEALRDATGSAAGRVIAAIDARRGEVFAGAYEHRPEGTCELLHPRALPPQELAGMLADGDAAAGARSSPWLAVGDGALRFREAFEGAGASVPADSSPLHLVRASAICHLGALAPALGAEAVVPDYRRRPDAELALEVAASSGPLT